MLLFTQFIEEETRGSEKPSHSPKFTGGEVFGPQGHLTSALTLGPHRILKKDSQRRLSALEKGKKSKLTWLGNLVVKTGTFFLMQVEKILYKKQELLTKAIHMVHFMLFYAHWPRLSAGFQPTFQTPGIVPGAHLLQTLSFSSHFQVQGRL